MREQTKTPSRAGSGSFTVTDHKSRWKRKRHYHGQTKHNEYVLTLWLTVGICDQGKKDLRSRMLSLVSGMEVSLK